MMVLKVNLFKRAAFTQKKFKIQLGLKIKDNNNTVNIRKQIRAFIAN